MVLNIFKTDSSWNIKNVQSNDLREKHINEVCFKNPENLYVLVRNYRINISSIIILMSGISYFNVFVK